MHKITHYAYHIMNEFGSPQGTRISERNSTWNKFFLVCLLPSSTIQYSYTALLSAGILKFACVNYLLFF